MRIKPKYNTKLQNMKPKFYQRIGTNCILMEAHIDGKVVERFTIREDVQFHVTSNLGVDTLANRLTFSTIQKAIKYIIDFATNSREY